MWSISYTKEYVRKFHKEIKKREREKRIQTKLAYWHCSGILLYSGQSKNEESTLPLYLIEVIPVSEHVAKTEIATSNWKIKMALR